MSKSSALISFLEELSVEDRRVISIQIDKYGYTKDIKAARFITPDGKMIRTAKGREYRSHASFVSGGVGNDYTILADWIKEGNIRVYIDGNNGDAIFEIGKEPTSAQYSLILKVIKNTVSGTFDLHSGSRKDTMSYYGDKPDAVLNKVKNFFTV